MNITRSPGQDLIPDSLLIHILANSMVCGQVQSNADRAMTSNKSLSFRECSLLRMTNDRVMSDEW